MSKQSLFAGIVLATFVAGFLAPATAVAKVSVSNCVTNKTSFTFSSYGDSTEKSQKFRALSEGTVDFNQKKAGCVIVRFSAHVWTRASGRSAIFRAMLDPKPYLEGPHGPLGLPHYAAYAFIFNEVEDGVRSHEFVFPNVAAGPHKILIQWRQAGAESGRVDTYHHTTLVHHN